MCSAASTSADAVALVLRELQPRAAACGAELLVVGAAARDLLLSTPSPRATNDVDVAVAVEAADAVVTLTAGLEEVRLHARRYVIEGVLVDVVPFGGVEAADRTVTSDGFRMNVLGFSEALAAAVEVALPGDVTARVASLPAQVVLKLVAWSDRRNVTERDAVDLRSLLVDYASPQRIAALYDDPQLARIERHDYDPEAAAADLIGAEAAAVVGAGIDPVTRLVERELADDGVLPVHMGGDPDRNRILLRALLTGMRST